MSTLKGISSYCGASPKRGLITVEYLPIAYVAGSTSKLLYDFQHEWYGTVASAANWLEAKLLTSQRIWNDVQQNSEQGPYYERELAGLIPYWSPDLMAELEYMKQFRYLVRVTDRQQNRYLLNDWEHGMEFSSDTNHNGISTQETRITFNGLVPKQSFLWPVP